MDIMSAEKRSALMSRIRGRDTGIELTVQTMLQELELEHESQVRDLPGRPDFVLHESRVAVFVDGDFWHGWRFPAWKHKLSPKWQDKISANRRRDRNNHAKLRRRGWKVLRIWEHDIEKRPDWCLQRLACIAENRDPRTTD
jgi:DNA mismatch endonuclease (patch repair protein)